MLFYYPCYDKATGAAVNVLCAVDLLDAARILAPVETLGCTCGTLGQARKRLRDVAEGGAGYMFGADVAETVRLSNRAKEILDAARRVVADHS